METDQVSEALGFIGLEFWILDKVPKSSDSEPCALFSITYIAVSINNKKHTY
jgi:hypothetical protein